MDFEEHKYKDYRNPKFRKFITISGEIMTCFMIVFAFYAMNVRFGFYVTFSLTLLYFLVQNMRKQMIYFFSNKDLGPDWKETLIKDLAESFRSSLVVAGGNFILCMILSILRLG